MRIIGLRSLNGEDFPYMEAVRADITEYFANAKLRWIEDYNKGIIDARVQSDFINKVRELQIDV